VLGDEETAAVGEVLASGELAQGRWVAEFEEAFAEFCGARYAVATSSGTTALHLALLAHGIGNGDEVVTTPFTFIASSNAILYVGARPVFADVRPDTYNIDPAQLERFVTPRTRAVLAVDLYGLPADLPTLADFCERRGLVLIEDASQSHGAEINGRRTGSFGTATFSFYPSKNMTTGEGGMITTNDPKVAEAARVLRHHGTTGTYVHDVLGFNHRMTNLQAAIGLVQLGRLPDLNARRQANAKHLTEALPGLRTPTVPAGVRHVFHQYTLRIGAGRDRFAELLRRQGVESRVYYPVPVHRQPLYRTLGLDDAQAPEAERAAAEVLSIPVHPRLSSDELERVAVAARAAWEAVGGGAHAE
jgi:dTDP-4-amino-4,6-dideoxygalactose transaminase